MSERTRARRSTSTLSPHLFDLLPYIRRRFHNVSACALERFHLLRRGTGAAADDRAGMTHAPSRRCGLAGDEGNDRFLEVRLYVRRPLFLGRSADLADHDDRFRRRIRFECGEAIDEV